MSSTEGGAVDAVDAIDWEVWCPTRPSAQRRRRVWPVVVLAIVVIAHGLATLVMILAEPAPLRSERFEEAMVVSFIERPPTTAQPALPRPVSNRTDQAPTDKQRLRAAAGDQEPATAQIRSDEAAAVAPLRLHLDEDVWGPQQRAPDKIPWQRQADAAREWEQPHVAGITVRPPPSLKQKLAMLGALFGSPPYDPCPQVAGRLANPSQLHALDLQADLQTRERHCRP